MKTFLNTKKVLIVILFLATFLRLFRLGSVPPSLFGDELDLGYHAYSILKTGRDYQGNFTPVHFHSLAEWRTPLYLYAAVPTVAIFGITPFGVRLPAVIFGILSVLMMYLFVKELKINNSLKIKNFELKIEEISAFLLAISPWSLQYSRAGFEVTLLLFLLILGLYLFFKSLSNPKWFFVSVLCLVLTPWAYSTAKFFTPFLLIFLFGIYFKEIIKFPRKEMILTIVTGLIVGLPIAYGTMFGGGAQRFSYISVFADPTTISQVGFAREMSARIRGETGLALSPTITDRIFYNKYTFWGRNILKNYLTAFSTEFLFIKGDPNPRQSVGIGELYRIELIVLVVGFVLFLFNKANDKRLRMLMLFWLLLSVVPSSITMDGGNHATRLILMLPPLIFFISYGWVEIGKLVTTKYRLLFGLVVMGLYLISFMFYLNRYYKAYSWDSERWWHYGWGPSITEIKKIDKDYDRVIISMSGEPAWIFFAGYYQYHPASWQKDFPIGRDVEVDGFGKISHIDKFFFGSPNSKVQIYGLGNYINSKTLYLANASEIGNNLILHPEGVPPGLILLKSIPFPSGEPAMYLFAGSK